MQTFFISPPASLIKIHHTNLFLKYWTKVEVIGNAKCSSLLQRGIDYSCEKLYIKACDFFYLNSSKFDIKKSYKLTSQTSDYGEID